jgi:predicted nicotinamide N-methyase
MFMAVQATVIRESVLPSETRKVTALLDICLSGQRSDASYAAPSEGLLFAGVGYDTSDMVPLNKPSNKALKRKEKAAAKAEQAACQDSYERNSLEDNDITHKKHKAANLSADESIDATAMNICPSSSSSTLKLSLTDKGRTDDTNAEISTRWQSFQHELVSVDNSMVFYPERAFTFASCAGSGEDGTMVIAQNAGDVGTIIWDSEVILAHLVDDLLQCDAESSAHKHIIELGAGSALAAAVCARNNSVLRVTVQELPHVVPYTLDMLRKCLKIQTLMQIDVLAGKWGELELEQTHRHAYDLVMMADVLYHTEDFTALVSMIASLCKTTADIIVVAEQRRKSLDSFVLAMVGAGFVLDKHVKYCVVSSDSAEDDSVGKKVTEFHIWQFKVTGM